MDMLKRFWNEEDGMGTVEIVLIIAVLVAIVLIFRGAIVGFIKNATGQVFNSANEITSNIGGGTT